MTDCRIAPVSTLAGYPADRSAGSRVATIGLAVVIALAGALALWGFDREVAYYDSGAYLVTAKSLATGQGYANVNLPENPPQGLYPPVVPFLYSAVWRIWPAFPANLVFVKGVAFALAIGFLLTAFFWFRTVAGLSAAAAVAGVALLGFHPLFLLFSTEPSSEIPYAVLSLVALLAYARFERGREPRWLIMAVIAAAMTALTRSIGTALVCALVCDALWHRRVRVSAAIALAAATAIVPWTLWSWHAREAYAAYPAAIATNYRGYVVNMTSTDWARRLAEAVPLNAVGFATSWMSWIAPWPPSAAALFVVVVGTAPLVARLREPRVHGWYVAAAGAAILLWPWPVNDRFVFVLSPFAIASWLAGVRILGEAVRGTGVRRAVQICTVAVIGVAIARDCYIDMVIYRDKAGRGQIRADFHRTIDWLDAHTDRADILVAPHDPAFYLFSGRKTIRIAYPDPFAIYYRPVVHPAFRDPDGVLDWFRQVGACYIIRDPLNGPADSAYSAALIESLRQTEPAPLRSVYRNPSFEVFRISSCEERR